MFKELMRDLNKLSGQIGFYYKNLVNGEEFCYGEEKRLEAASVIKIPVIVEVLRQIENKTINPETRLVVEDEDKVPSCGALFYMDSGLEVTLRDLYTLMIIHSDNTATNILIDLVGMDGINKTLENLGFREIILSRKMFDSERVALGIENYISSREIGQILEMGYRGELISEGVSREIIRVLKLQRLNSKLPYLLPKGTEVAHKTGEDSGITHDVGIIYAKEPFILCFNSNGTNVIETENSMRKIALDLYNYNK